jgi:hypothetical protein
MAKDNRWVVLIYMAATSPELKELMERELGEMAARLRLLEPADLRAYALMDTPDGRYAVQHTLHRPASKKGSSKRKAADDSVERAAQILPLDTGLEEKLGKKAAFLAQFINWRFTPNDPFGVSEFGHTLLILWGHSQGVAAALSKPGSPAYAMVGNGGFGFNDLSGESLSLPEIRRAIAEGLSAYDTDKKIDILSFDSCFMSAAEVSAEFQRKAPGLAPDAELNEPDEEPEDDTPDSEGRPSSKDEALLKLRQAAREAKKRERKERLRAKAARLNERLIAETEANKAARVDYVIASQSAVLLDGLDYGRIVDVFIDAKLTGNMGPGCVGRSLLQQACSGGRSPVNLALLCTGDPDAYECFSKAFRNLVTVLGELLDTGTDLPTAITPPERPRFVPSRVSVTKGAPRFSVTEGANRSEWLRIRDAFEGATWHRVRQFIDVADLCRRLANNSRELKLRRAARGVLRALDCPDHPPLVDDVRSAHPLVFSGLSLYCPWLFPSPADVRTGAWNAVVDLFDYSRDLWFNRGSNSWGALVYHAKHVLEESRQRAINTELADLRDAGRDSSGGPPMSSGAIPGTLGKTGGGDAFNVAEPETAQGSSESAGSQTPFAAMRMRALAADLAASQAPERQVSITPTGSRD